eukprot:10689411-Lingulodinium_polyedra.AAC.1
MGGDAHSTGAGRASSGRFGVARATAASSLSNTAASKDGRSNRTENRTDGIVHGQFMASSWPVHG